MKGNLLPKWMREKGKSKYFYPRLRQEKIEFGNIAWMGDLYDTPANKLWNKLSKKLNKTI